MKSRGKKKEKSTVQQPQPLCQCCCLQDWRPRRSRERFNKKAARPGEKPAPPSGGSSGPPSFSVCPSPTPFEDHWVSTLGRHHGGGGAIPVVLGGLGSPPPLLLSPLGCQWPGLAARCPGPRVWGIDRAACPFCRESSMLLPAESFRSPISERKKRKPQWRKKDNFPV